MLFLRDIATDLLIRCRACGHEGTLARAEMERRFGPGYPVLSIGPHYRCSRCNMRQSDILTDLPPPPPPSPDADADADFLAKLSALRGMVDAVRPTDRDTAYGEDAHPRHDDRPDDRDHDRDAADDPAYIGFPGEEPLMSWRPGPEPDDGPIRIAPVAPIPDAPIPDAPVTEGAANDDETPPAWPLRDRPFFTAPTMEEEEREEDTATGPDPHAAPMWEPDPADTSAATSRQDRPGREEEPSADEILSFAIRDPDRRAPDTGIDETMAALRSMIETAADAPPPPPRPLRSQRRLKEDAKPPPPEPVPFNHTLAKLRGLLDLDDDAPDPKRR